MPSKIKVWIACAKAVARQTNNDNRQTDSKTNKDSE